jgi:hypothetical protein
MKYPHSNPLWRTNEGTLASQRPFSGRSLKGRHKSLAKDCGLKSGASVVPLADALILAPNTPLQQIRSFHLVRDRRHNPGQH